MTLLRYTLHITQHGKFPRFFHANSSRARRDNERATSEVATRGSASRNENAAWSTASHCRATDRWQRARRKRKSNVTDIELTGGAGRDSRPMGTGLNQLVLTRQRSSRVRANLPSISSCPACCSARAPSSGSLSNVIACDCTLIDDSRATSFDEIYLPRAQPRLDYLCTLRSALPVPRSFLTTIRRRYDTPPRDHASAASNRF